MCAEKSDIRFRMLAPKHRYSILALGQHHSIKNICIWPLWHLATNQFQFLLAPRCWMSAKALWQCPNLFSSYVILFLSDFSETKFGVSRLLSTKLWDAPFLKNLRKLDSNSPNLEGGSVWRWFFPQKNQGRGGGRRGRCYQGGGERDMCYDLEGRDSPTNVLIYLLPVLRFNYLIPYPRKRKY